MIPYIGLIRLTIRNSKVRLDVNVDKIETIKDFRTDSVMKDIIDAHFTEITVGGRSYEVNETEDEIQTLMAAVCNINIKQTK